MFRPFLLKLAAAGLMLAPAGAAAAQVSTVDPNSALEQPVQPGWEEPAAPAAEAPAEAAAVPDWEAVEPEYQPIEPQASESASAEAAASAPAGTASERASEAMRPAVPRKDVFTAAEGVFGKGAEGLADLIEDLLRKQGEPIAYITGQEAGGAFVIGARYGSGTLHHQIEGDRPIYWTGPSLGFDFGADASKVFVLVYNLHDAERIFKRYPAAEGNAYVVGGFTASYLRRGDVVLIPIRLGVGLRLGINAGYMRFSEKNRWLPF